MIFGTVQKYRIYVYRCFINVNFNNPKPIKLQCLVLLYFVGLSTVYIRQGYFTWGRVSQFHPSPTVGW